MPRSSPLTAHPPTASAKNAPAPTLPSRESGFVLGARRSVPAAPAECPLCDRKGDLSTGRAQRVRCAVSGHTTLHASGASGECIRYGISRAESPHSDTDRGKAVSSARVRHCGYECFGLRPTDMRAPTLRNQFDTARPCHTIHDPSAAPSATFTHLYHVKSYLGGHDRHDTHKSTP